MDNPWPCDASLPSAVPWGQTPFPKPHLPLPPLASQGQGPQRQSYLWGCDKGMGLRVGVIAACEIPVVGGDNCVLLPLFDVLSARSEETGLGTSSLVTWPVLTHDRGGGNQSSSLGSHRAGGTSEVTEVCVRPQVTQAQPRPKPEALTLATASSQMAPPEPLAVAVRMRPCGPLPAGPGFSQVATQGYCGLFISSQTFQFCLALS